MIHRKCMLLRMSIRSIANMSALRIVCAVLTFALCSFVLVDVEGALLAPTETSIQAAPSGCPEDAVKISPKDLDSSVEALIRSMTGHFSASNIQYTRDFVYKTANANGIPCWGPRQQHSMLSLLDILSPDPSPLVKEVPNDQEISDRMKVDDVSRQIDVLAPVNTCNFSLFGKTWKAYSAAILCQSAYYFGLFSGPSQIYFGASNAEKMAHCYTSVLEYDPYLRAQCRDIENGIVFYYCGSDYRWKYEVLHGGKCMN
mmetsp:Transcript_12902/g.23189  ORF Transcript_12902/g.23189 Transcript_12902/m.23189 type:complete len:257 (+) Transcript_12902:103-873(+)